MRYWHWARFTDVKGNAAARRSHGIELRPRWNGTGTPPLHTSPPFIGTPALETTHPFHFQMNPGVLLGPTCNHDLGVLLRLPPDTSPTQKGNASEKKAATSAMLDAMGNSEYYLSLIHI